MTKTSLLAAVVALSLPALAFAQTAPAPATAPTAAPVTAVAPKAPDNATRSKFRAACGADIAKHCGDAVAAKGATPEETKAQRGKVRACLTTHNAQLSTDCKAALTEIEAKAAQKKS